MIDDYNERFYSILESRSSDIKVNNYHLARVLSRWKKQIASQWDQIKVLDIQYSSKPDDPVIIGDKYHILVKLDVNGLDPDDIGVELVVVKTHSLEESKFVFRKEFTNIVKNDNEIMYKLKSIPTEPGAFKMGIRIFPKHPKLAHQQDFAYLKWI